MKKYRLNIAAILILLAVAIWLVSAPVLSQSIDRTQNPNIANAGIAKSLAQEVGSGRGDWQTPDSSSFIIARDPFRAIRDRKSTRLNSSHVEISYAVFC